MDWWSHSDKSWDWYIRVPDTGATAPPNASVAETQTLKQEEEEQAIHQCLRTLIKKHRKDFMKRKSLLTTDNIASKLLNLEALDQYNDKCYELQRSRRKLKIQIQSSPANIWHKLKEQLSKICPATDTSKVIAGHRGHGPHFQRTFRSMANKLLNTGRFPKNNQGKGGHHKSLLSWLEIYSALQKWVKGTIPYDEGGFNGRVSNGALSFHDQC